MRKNNYLVTGKDLKVSVAEGWLFRVPGSEDIPDLVCVNNEAAMAFVELDPSYLPQNGRMPLWQEIVPLHPLPDNMIELVGTMFLRNRPQNTLIVSLQIESALPFAEAHTLTIKTRNVELRRIDDNLSVPMDASVTVTTIPGQHLSIDMIVYDGPLYYDALITVNLGFEVFPMVVEGHRLSRILPIDL
ncbi:hypothetical protein PBAL39_13412 [Pedobacter sp. BAL39]|uniref:hypothetical protein n=1 Tax=Pedobacter sp. BAL39 TaxID=391596 RepID=UPI0001559964|nr:hypothetical protein [Pedobacter sp. BAL39]EDM35233.1 hypothetical protein PBAL39_13412 [Pedobacter sp. BAL39]